MVHCSLRILKLDAQLCVRNKSFFPPVVHCALWICACEGYVILYDCHGHQNVPDRSKTYTDGQGGNLFKTRSGHWESFGFFFSLKMSTIYSIEI